MYRRSLPPLNGYPKRVLPEPDEQMLALARRALDAVKHQDPDGPLKAHWFIHSNLPDSRSNRELYEGLSGIDPIAHACRDDEAAEKLVHILAANLTLKMQWD